ncbi:MAG: hypothetical protein KDC54_17615, partial [Lewinella sp.]|nr:hypothetical protein [Lewinella sp.]
MKILKTFFSSLLFLLGTVALTAQNSDCADVTISVIQGETDINCQGDGVPDRVVFKVTPGGMPVGYVVVDENDIILYIGGIGNINFDVLPTGTLHVYGFAYNTAITGQVGENINESQLANFCYGISDNFITINSSNPDGGMVSTVDGETEVSLCVGDGNPDIVTFATTSTDASYVYLITDENNVILAVSTTGDADFDGAEFGVCHVWGLAYAGDLLAAPGQDATTATLSSECFELSENFITVNRIYPDAGLVSLEDGSSEYVSCSSGEPTGSVSVFATNFEPLAQYTFVAVDPATDEILFLLDDNSVALADLPVGATNIYGISYTGNLIVGPGDSFVGGFLSDDCDDRSDNFVTIVKRILDAGTVALDDGSEQATICVGDGLADELTLTNTFAGPDSYTYLITDENNLLLSINDGPVIDFESPEDGNWLVWGLAYSGTITVAAGDDIMSGLPLADECYDLTDNFVLVNRNGPNGGEITLADGSTSFISCTTMEPTAVTVDFVVTGQDPNLAYTYLVVDTETDLVAAILDAPSLSLAELPVGHYQVYGLSYLDNLTIAVGDTFTGAEPADICYDYSDNAVTVVKRVQDAGSVSLADGSGEIYICPGDGSPDLLELSHDYNGPDNFVYLITDESDVLQQVLVSNTFDFDVAGPDVVRVYGMVFSGNFLLQPGFTVTGGQALSSECYALTDNYVTVYRTGPVGGLVSLTDGSTSIDLCVGDGVSDLITYQTTGGGNNYIWLITDENNFLTGTVADAEFDFENAVADNYHIWGLAYNGQILLFPGDLITETQLATECYELSENFISVQLTAVDGGTVSLEDGTTTAFACTMDGEPDFYTFTNTSAIPTATYQYIITDEDNIILAVLMGSSVNLDEAAPGNCRVWGVSYTGNLLADLGDDAGAIALSDGCYTLSDNFVLIRREEVMGGEVSLANGDVLANICPGDDMEDLLPFQTTGTTTDQYTYVITDTDNNIVGFAPDGELDFNNLSAPAILRVWGLAYSGIITAQGGDNAATTPLSSECYELSDNFITVIREVPDGGAVSTTDGQTSLYLCTDDGFADEIFFSTTGASNTPYAYLITDENNNVMAVLTDVDSFDFEGAEAGVCRVWGVAYTGAFNVDIVGENAAEVALSDDCYGLSENFITVVRGQLNAGTVTTSSGADIRYTCPGDGESDVITLDSVGAGTGTYAYLLTGIDNVILEVLDGDSYDFEPLPEGIYYVWGLIYTGDLLAEAGMDAGTATLATGCAQLSGNFVSVVHQAPVAGTITTGTGETEVNICVGDGAADYIVFNISGASNAAYLYLVTEEDGALVGALADNFLDFENTATGTWRVYGLSYTGSVVVLPGANIFEDQLASGCYEVTENFIEINKEQVDGGQLFTEDLEQVVYVCPDGEPDVVNFVNSGAAGTANYQYVLTTQDNFVLSLLPGNSFDFETVANDFDQLRLWGVSYTGMLTLGLGQNAGEVPLSDGCYTLSQNYIDIFIDAPEGGAISVAGEADTVRLCHSNFMPGLNVSTSSTSQAGYAYIVTDSADVVLGVSQEPNGFVDFTPYEPGFYHIWGLSYTGSLTIMAGDTVTNVTPATSCFAFSDNYLVVERTESLNAGEISDISGADIINVCPADGQPDLVVLSNNSPDAQYRYFITDENNNILVPDIEDNVINFNPASPGIVRIWGLSYTGDLDLNNNENAETGILSTDCWALSNNYITVIIQAPEGGAITTAE